MKTRILSAVFGLFVLFVTHAFAAVAPAVMSSPANGSNIASTQTFSWTSPAGRLEYFFYAGSSVGSNNGYAASLGTTPTLTLSGLPTNGSTVYVRLFTRFSTGWYYNDYSYRTSAPAVASKAAMVSPSSGSTLASSSQTFTWSAGSGALEYIFSAGPTLGSSFYSTSLGKGLSISLGGLPTDGSKIYVRLTTRFSNGSQFNDYVYTAFKAAPTGIQRPANAPTKWGQVLGNNAITVFNNGYSGYDSKVRNPVTVNVPGQGNVTFEGGIAYQCVEIVRRAAVLINKSDPGRGNAVDWYGMTSYFTANPDKGTVKPAVGDIVVWSGVDGAHIEGHVALITAVGSTSVTLAEQNVLCTSRDAAHVASMTTGRNASGYNTYSIDSFAPNSTGGFKTLGWMRKR